MTSSAIPTSTDVRTPANHIGGAWTPSQTTEHLDDREPADTRKKVVTCRWAA
jgi:malonate-semialdehyde dehydrogenase (acetylating)/methylmalonate-semialdehyde dehydrogenase